MASLVANNPYDMTQQKFAGTGDVTGQITGGARNGMNWDFMDQQGKVLTSIPYQDFVNNYQSDGSGAVRSGVNAVNGVQVFDFNNRSAAAPAATSPGLVASAQPAAPASAPAGQGIVGGAIRNVSTGTSATVQNAPAAGPSNSASAATFNPETREVDQATETAAGQVNSLLANDNPLLQRARTLAMQNMNRRGLVNSSMSQGAGVAAMVDRITPIAQQDAQTYSQRALANMEAKNQAGMFNVGETNKFSLQNAQQNFIEAQANLDRAQQTFLADKSIAAQKDLQLAQQTFQGAQAELDRTQQTSIANLQVQANKDLQTAQQTFQGAQAELERAFQTVQQDKSIAAQQALQSAQQSFASAQAELDRVQQANVANANIAAQAALNEASTQAAALQADLDRRNQAALTEFTVNANNAAVAKTFALNTATNVNASINAVLADPNIKPEDKAGAIDNIVKAGNSTLQWGATFYNATLPTITAPGGTAGVVTPGAGAGTGTSTGTVNTPTSGTKVTVNPVTVTPATSGKSATTATNTAATPTPAPAPSAISSFVSNVLANGASPAEQAAAINQAAASSGVSREQIAAATGYSLDQVNAFLK